MNNNIQAIVFDIGNVLVTFRPQEFLHELYRDSAKEDACYSLIFRSPEWEALDHGTLSAEEAKSILKDRAPALSAELDRFFENWLDMFRPIEATIQLLQPLKERGYKLYILSNIIRETHQGLRSRYTFLDEFDGVVASCEVGSAKPEPEIYHYLLQTYRLDAKECLFIDDMPANIAGAQAAGIPTIQFESPAQLTASFKERGIL